MMMSELEEIRIVLANITKAGHSVPGTAATAPRIWEINVKEVVYDSEETGEVDGKGNPLHQRLCLGKGAMGEVYSGMLNSDT